MSRYIKYVIKNIEPLRIADDSSSQNGQTITLRYIPGSAIRGYLINQLAKETNFEEIKKELFSTKTKYLNAYLTVDGKALLPSPKGFYENKQECTGKKQIQNVVVNKEFSGECKRASLGRYCYMQGDCIYYYNVDTSSDLKIKINLQEQEKQNVFRNDYITEGHTFTGYISVENQEIAKKIKALFKGNILLGNARSSGCGKCKVVECSEINSLPYEFYMPKKNLQNKCYMMLLSATAMRNVDGELCGLDETYLEEKLGVTGLKIECCSTSTVTVRGYNRMWGTKIPSVVMYEQGSVFQFTYQGVLSVAKMKQLMEEGIGIRRNEGFGRVLFLNDYEKIQYKLAGTVETKLKNTTPSVNEEDKKVLRIAAKGYYNNILLKKIEEYVVKNPLDRRFISNSQLGVIESLVYAYQYNPMLGVKKIEEYLAHTGNKQSEMKVQKAKKNVMVFGNYVLDILSSDLPVFLNLNYNKIMGWKISDVLTPEELLHMKFLLIQNLIRYEYKKGEV